MTFVPAMPDDDLWIGEMRALTLAGRRVLLLRLTDRGVRAYENRCAHLGLPLHDGTLVGSVLTCRHHCFKYDAGTGRGINPASTSLVALPVTIIAGQIMVGLAAGDSALDSAAGDRDV